MSERLPSLNASPDALKPALRRPLDRSSMSNDVGALNQLLGLLNSPAITGADIPAEEKANVRARADFPPLAPELPPAPSVVSENIVLPEENIDEPKNVSRKYFFTGQSKAGKQYIAAQTGLPIFRTTDLLKNFCETFGVNPSVPGAQAFYDLVFQWGRGTITEKYPITPARICFVDLVHKLVAGTLSEVWAEYGKSNSLYWLQHAIRNLPETGGILIGVNSTEDFQYLQSQGFRHFHIMASPQTRQARGGVGGSTASLASRIDDSVTQQISHVKNGPPLHVIWSDASIPCPSPRIQSVAQFLETFKQSIPVTGE